ncbi:hypothetical protein [Enterococcus gilvus]|uniref:hypothetical protein n=1 Tax=Enterococcus gilvus TaxID=160453 RepID=UPI003ED9AAD5
MTQIPRLVKLYVIDKVTDEKMKVRTMKYRNGEMPATVEVMTNPTSEKNGVTSYDLRRINLSEKIPDDSKIPWQLDFRFELVMEDGE